MKIPLLSAVFLGVYFFASSTVYACSCPRPGAPAEELKRSEEVFSGKVIRVNRGKQDIDYPFTALEAVFDVEKRWKGSENRELSVFTALDSAACGFNFEAGEKYLVYAARNSEKRLVTTICTRTKKLSDAGEDLEALDKARSGPSTSNPGGNFIEVDENIRLFYQKIGTGKQTIVVPLHLFLFEDFKHLAKDKTFIFYDVRNRGRSDAVADGSKITIQDDVEDLEKLRRHFKLEKMSLIGESYVGLMVVMYAMKYPEHVDRLIQIGPVPLKYGTTYPKEFTPNDPSPVPDVAESAKIDELYKQDYHKTHPRDFCEKDWAVSRFGLVGDPKNVSKLRSVCHLQNEWPVNLYRHFVTHFVSVQKLDIPKQDVAKITAPVLTIHGTRDRNAVYGAGREWAQLLPNARLLTVKDAAHFPWVDDPKLVFGSINAFLSGQFPKQAEKIPASTADNSR